MKKQRNTMTKRTLPTKISTQPETAQPTPKCYICNRPSSEKHKLRSLGNDTYRCTRRKCEETVVANCLRRCGIETKEDDYKSSVKEIVNVVPKKKRGRPPKITMTEPAPNKGCNADEKRSNVGNETMSSVKQFSNIKGQER